MKAPSSSIIDIYSLTCSAEAKRCCTRAVFDSTRMECNCETAASEPWITDIPSIDSGSDTFKRFKAPLLVGTSLVLSTLMAAADTAKAIPDTLTGRDAPTVPNAEAAELLGSEGVRWG